MEPLAKLWRSILRYGWSFLIIVLVLAAGRFLTDQFSELDESGLAQARLHNARNEIAEFASDFSDQVSRQTQAIVSQTLSAQESLLDNVNQEIAALESQASSTSDLILLLATGDGIEYAKDTLRLEMLRQQRNYLQKLIQVTSAVEGKRACVQRLVVLGKRSNEAARQAKDNEARRARLDEQYNFPRWNPASDGYDEYQKLLADYRTIERRREDAAAVYQDQEVACELITVPDDPKVFTLDSAQQDMFLSELDSAIADATGRWRSSWLGEMFELIKSVIYPALWIFAGLIIIPPTSKLVFYFALAPAASRLAPIRIIPNPQAPPIPEPLPSAVSIAIDVLPAEELLVQPDFLQSSSLPARKRTKWLLNPQLPFASITSGMFALTCIRPEGVSASRVVISSQKDPFGEIGVIEVPAGAAMIVQPRSLAGVVKPAGIPVAISKHWRLSSPHAWLTLQLRYLAFHGPCKLILKGCRGVRSEEPDQNQPRLINQAATLGFSANLDYKTTRCETFVPYFRGQEDLFNDLFAGGPGRFIYEEMPAAGGKTGVISRGLEGVVDAVLKVFGI